MKVIDLLNKIANGEIPPIIIFDTEKYEYISGHYVRDYDGIHIDLSDDYNLYRCLNDEVEILDEEDEFEDIEHYDMFDYFGGYDFGGTNKELLGNLQTNFEHINNELDSLIKNQKLIINKLKEEGK